MQATNHDNATACRRTLVGANKRYVDRAGALDELGKTSHLEFAFELVIGQRPRRCRTRLRPFIDQLTVQSSI
jgi:hypothetical protein